MKAKGRKKLVGMINSRGKGLGWRTQDPSQPVVQSSRTDNDAHERLLREVLAEHCDSREMLDRVYLWADNTDGTVVSLTGTEQKLLEPFWEWATEAGYLEKPSGPLAELEDFDFELLPDRIKCRTQRLKERAKG